MTCFIFIITCWPCFVLFLFYFLFYFYYLFLVSIFLSLAFWRLFLASQICLLKLFPCWPDFFINWKMKLGPARQHFTSNSLICYATTLKGHYCDITPLKIPTISCFFPHPYVQAYKSPFFPKNVLTHPTTVLNWLPLPWVWTADPLPGLEPMFAKYIHSLSQLTINTPHWTAAPGPVTLSTNY